MIRIEKRSLRPHAEPGRAASVDLPANTEGHCDGDTGPMSWTSELVTWHSASFHDTDRGLVAIFVG